MDVVTCNSELKAAASALTAADRSSLQAPALLPLVFTVEREEGLHLLDCLFKSLYEQINVLNLGYKILNGGEV